MQTCDGVIGTRRAAGVADTHCQKPSRLRGPNARVGILHHDTLPRLEEDRLAWETKGMTAVFSWRETTTPRRRCATMVYLLIVNCSARDGTANIGARGLTHTRYKGCYFWDTDLFMVPFYLLTDPEAARSLMRYRVNTLPQAKEHAGKMCGADARYHNVCFDRLQRYKVVKQADVLLLMTRLAERFTAQEKADAWADFEPLCLHDSTLSFASHALFAAQNGLTDAAKAYFDKALYLDLKEVMGNTGKEGLHLACLGETWQAVVFGFAGLHIKEGIPQIKPQLPASWRSLQFKFTHMGKQYRVSISSDSSSIEQILSN